MNETPSAAVTMIKVIRMLKGVRQWDVAQEVGISESYLSKIETGKVTPKDELLGKIANALDIPIELLSNSSLTLNALLPIMNRA